VPISFARELFERENEISYIEIRVNSQNIENAEEYLLKKFKSSKYSVKNRLQQQENLYKMFESEKWVTFALLTFVLLLASFNVTGTLSMLVLEKQKDIFTLTTLGANASFIRKIFIKEGILISLFGGSIGLFFGIILVLLQDKFGFIKMTGSIIDSYPVKLHWNDALLVLFTSLLLGLLTSFYPAWKAYRKK
jgi:ABC-type lipoprotein release transport system permease subunit